jgi:DNA-directed RNA polymerase specialized sigma subunit
MEDTQSSTLSREEADQLVLDNKNWAEGVAKSVARAWNLDWQSDGLDGAALEALIFCARRYDPNRAIPFRGYARKRIHEAACEAARKSKTWLQKTTEAALTVEERARDLSYEIVKLFPELRDGDLPGGEDSHEGEYDTRAGIRSLLIGATMAAASQSAANGSPEELYDFKKIVEVLSHLEPIHQEIMWKIYWEGDSMRTIASGWETDELNVIREHKVLITYLYKSINTNRVVDIPRVRPGLKSLAVKVNQTAKGGLFRELISQGA